MGKVEVLLAVEEQASSAETLPLFYKLIEVGYSLHPVYLAKLSSTMDDTGCW